MSIKANSHPLVRDLRRMLDKHGLHGAVLVGVTAQGRPVAVSAGSDVRKCDAVGPVLDGDAVSMLLYEIDYALVSADQPDLALE